MGQLFAGRYEFVDLLGRGGMGDVWRVWDHREQVYRAAKLQRQADSASLLRFVRESSTRVEHPRVVAPTGWSADDGTVLFAMPIVGGGSVAHVIADHGPLAHDWVRSVAVQLFEALHAVHEAGLVHRDVKPANLLLEATGTGPPVVRLSDFGIAAATDEPRLTRAWEVVHTPGYTAPEALTDPDPRPTQDLYGAGVVLVEMLTGERPSRTGPPEVPEGPFAEVIKRLVAVDPDDRFVTAAQACEAVAAVPVAHRSGDPVEVFDHLPAWPEGWGPSGPEPARLHQSSLDQPLPDQPSLDPPLADPSRRAVPLPTPSGEGPQRASQPARRTAPQQRGVPGVAVLLAVIGALLLVAALVTSLL